MPPRYAQTPDDMPGADQLWQMSGLDYIHRICDGTFPVPPMAQLFGFEIDTVKKGHVAFRGTADFRSANAVGGVHGGWYGTLLDSALGCAVMTMMPQGSAYTTLEYKVNITRAVPMGMAVLAAANVQHAGRSTAVANAEIRGIEDGRVYATGSTTCIVMQRE